MDLEFRYLRDFLAVVESGSLGDAARRLKTSQPTLTRSVKLLEESVGGAVFDRTPHGMRPTALGRTLERRARVIIGEVGAARRELDDLVDARRGQVVVGSGPSFAASILPRAIARFQAKHPQVDVVVIQNQMRDTLAALKSGEIDCAFHAAPETLDPDLAHRVVLRGSKTVLVARSDHPLAAKARVRIDEVARQPWLMARHPDYFRRRLEAAFLRAGVTPPTPVIEYNSVLGTPRFLFESKGLVAVLNEVLIDAGKERARLAALNVPELTWTVTSSVIFRRAARLSPAATKLVESVRAVCAEQAGR